MVGRTYGAFGAHYFYAAPAQTVECLGACYFVAVMAVDIQQVGSVGYVADHMSVPYLVEKSLWHGWRRCVVKGCRAGLLSHEFVDGVDERFGTGCYDIGVG